MTAVIAIDAGTTGIRSIAFDENGSPTASSYREFTQHFPQPGWVEHDADEIWDGVVATLTEVIAQVGTPAAIGITDQRETVVVWDKRTSKPAHRAIVWQDRRTADHCAELEAAGHLDLVRRQTGLVLDPYFSGSKLGWLFSTGGVDAHADLAFGTVDSWLVWKLTAGATHITDTTNASRTLLFDTRAMRWSDDLLSLFDVPAHILPDVADSSGRFGETAAVDGLPAGIPISGIAGDQQASLFGQACFTPGMAKNTYGTGSFVLMNVGTECPDPVDGLLSTVAWTIGGQTTYALEGAIFVTGATIQWLRDGLGIIDDAAETGPLAESVPDTGGVFIVPAFAGLGSPWWDPYARGSISGITRGTTRAHIARAAVDAMVYQTRDVVDAMSAASGHVVENLRVDGGAAVMHLLLQRQADQLGVAVTRTAVADTTALGAAYLAGIAEGVWDSADDVQARWQADVTVQPQLDRAEADAEHAAWLDAVARTRS